MSWDVWLTTEIDGHEIEVWSGPNYTHNCNGMIRDAGLPEWPYRVDGWEGQVLYEHLTDCISNLLADPKKYRAMNPPNGWGDYDSLVRVLQEVRDHCQKFPSSIVRMSA